MTDHDARKGRLRKLGLYGLLDRYDDYADVQWLDELLDIEDQERGKRSLERRIRRAKLGRFKQIADFDWRWPEKIDREVIEELLTQSYLKDISNVVLVGQNGVGKTTIAKNIGYQALLKGHTVLNVTASEMLADLAAQDTSTALTRRLRRYISPGVLLVDEIGYLSYENRHGDLLFQVVSRRHESKPMIVTTNRPFAEWNEIFPNSTCVTALIDRLVHKADIVAIEGKSYRLKESNERVATKKKRAKKKVATRRKRS